MISLSWTELEFDLVPEREWRAPAFSGSMLRGALAAALRRLVCVMHRPVCTGCPLVAACVYPLLFETRPDPQAGVMRRYDRAPHPLVLVAAPGEPRGGAEPAQAGERLTLRLFGVAIAYAPFLVRAVGDMAVRGLGRDRTPFRLAAARDRALAADPLAGPPGARATMPPPPRLPPRRLWRLASPLRLLSGGRPLDAGTISGPAIGRAILRRVGLMAQFYGALPPDLDFRALAAEADRLRLEQADLAWTPLRRWSARQGATHSMGGLMGTVLLDFEAAPQLALLADWVPVVHLGKETMMGLGHVVARAA